MPSNEPEGAPEQGEFELDRGRRILAVLGSVGVAVAVCAGVFLLEGDLRLPGWTRILFPEDRTDRVQVRIDLAPVSSGSPAAKDPGHLGKTYTLKTFVVNILDRDRDRYLKVQTELELGEPELQDEIVARLPQIRDMVISLLGSKAFEDIRSIEGKNFLREEILLRINSLLVTGEIRRVFFTEFVVQ